MRSCVVRHVWGLSTAAFVALACGCEKAPKVVTPPVTVALPALPPSGPAGPAAKGPPPTRTVDVVESLHGKAVADPYRWLEDADAPDVQAWTQQQNAYTRGAIDAMGGRAELAAEAKKWLSIGFVENPVVRTTANGTRRYFHAKREGAQNQPTVYVRDGIDGKDRVLIDASSLSVDGTTSLDWWYPSEDGALVAWGRSDAGSEDSTLYVRDVATATDKPDRIARTRHASVAWMPDGKGFYYSRYPAKGTVPAGDEAYGRHIFFHALGDDPKDDVLVFGEGRNKTDTPSVEVSPNGRWLVVTVYMGWDKSEVYVKDLAKGAAAPWNVVAANVPAVFTPIPRNDKLYVKTNDGAPRYALYAVSYDRRERSAWKPVLPENEDVLDDVAIVDGDIVTTYMHDAATRIERFGLDGRSKGPVPLPTIGSASVTGAWNGKEVFVAFSSYVVPPRVYRLDLASPKATPPASKTAPPAATAAPPASLSPWDAVSTPFSGDEIQVERLFAISKDGTKIPMFVVGAKDFPRDGRRPTVLYGYGGFNNNMTPWFSARALTAVRRGVVWVTAVLRGGGEFGEDWHKAGMLANKQNVFDDFIACAETLVAKKITSPDQLGIMGGSNGGLLVAAAITQRPDLFRAALSLVPLTDMVRYPQFKIAQLWVPEYGDPSRAADFEWLYAYSPYHHVRSGVRYPSVLFTTAESDSRVDPMHARKMAARTQAAQADPSRPILLRVETKAGHGAGKPVDKMADELADEFTFLFHELGVGVPRNEGAPGFEHGF